MLTAEIAIATPGETKEALRLQDVVMRPGGSGRLQERAALRRQRQQQQSSVLLLLAVFAVRSAMAAERPLPPATSECRIAQGPLSRLQASDGGIKIEMLDPPRCKDKYRLFYENHTACLTASPSSSRPGVAEFEKDRIVQLHNYYRGRAGDESWHRQPTAANMQRMYWDDELARLAQQWASQCIFYHDKAAARYVPGYYSVGQNLARGHFNWDAAIRHWQSEVIELNFGQGRRFPKSMVGHYTQLVWADSSRLGCGFAKCNTTYTPFYVCNYGPTGNYPSRLYTPYQSGKKASACPDTNKLGLCDCGGKVCKNKGVLNVNTCECTCPRLDWIGGDDCSLNCTTAVDSQLCSTKGGHLTKEDCWLYEDVTVEMCPIMCGLCAARGKESTQEMVEECIVENNHTVVRTVDYAARSAAAVLPRLHQEDKDSNLDRLKALLGLENPDKHRNMAAGAAVSGRLEGHKQIAPVGKIIKGDEDPLRPAKVAPLVTSDLTPISPKDKVAKLTQLKERLGIEADGAAAVNSREALLRGAAAAMAAVVAGDDRRRPAANVAAGGSTVPLPTAKSLKSAAERQELLDRLLLGQSVAAGRPRRRW